MNKLTKDKFLTDKELEQLNKTLQRFKNDPHSLLIRLVLFTGARSAEALQITAGDLEDGAVFIRGAKGSNDREAHVPAAFFEELTQFAKGLARDQRLFPISERHFRRIWDQWRPVAKGGHCLRHTFGVRLYKDTRDINAVKHALGHKNIKNTMVYLDFVESNEKLKSAAESMWAA